ncbi:hypothetical protein [Kitasatospora sp. NPDC059571]|uniref:hypothetical protein n=1 Tax=Kitasatospora sp. NPDC059571 TaxID=3346871 RepID=UPI003680D417
MSARARLTNAIRDFADWLDANPQVDAPHAPRFLLPLHTNQAVIDFANEHGLETTADAEGNLSAAVTFGPVVYEAYGYVDFDTHRDACDERTARSWADRTGMQITPQV